MTLATKILIPTDLSTASVLAVDAGAVLAKTFGAAVHLFYVYDPKLFGPSHAEPSLIGLLVGTSDALPEVEKNARTELERLRAARLGEVRDVEVSIARHAKTAVAICGQAKAIGADLIVIATHGRGGVAHLLIGSVAEAVVRDAECPVLTLRSKAPR